MPCQLLFEVPEPLQTPSHWKGTLIGSLNTGRGGGMEQGSLIKGPPPQLMSWKRLPHFHWLLGNHGLLVYQLEPPPLSGGGLARLRNHITCGSSGLVPSCWVICIRGGKISQWLKCWRFIFRLQIMRKQVQQHRFSIMNMYGSWACARGVRHLVWIGDLEHPKRPYPFWGNFRSPFQGRSGDTDEITRLVGIWASECRCRCHSLMDFP